VSSFTTPLLVEILDQTRSGRITARLIEAFQYEVGALGSGEVIRVPKGYVTDFASVPRFFWRVEPPLGRAGKAAVVHDYLYSQRGCIPIDTPDWWPAPSGGHFQLYTREEADGIFREALAVLGVGALKRHMLWAAVRVGGGGGWG
jgi:hypothetical protein